MIGIPNPQSLTAEYDAWNRLVSIKDGATKISEHVYDARGYRIRKDTYTSGTLTEARHYYYTPGWQCVEERAGTLTTVERQFVWGLRYIDDLVLRDRSTANNGVINERRYAMQDGNWNTIAICDITGFVGERYAYSAYGTPVFMTGAGAVQASSPIGFETLYAGYRWDGTTPQMYYVRNRFLLPMIGTWNRRDPLGYVDGMNLYFYKPTINSTDPDGLLTLAFMPEVTSPPPTGGPVGGPVSCEASLIRCQRNATVWYAKCITKKIHQINSLFCVMGHLAYLNSCLAAYSACVVKRGGKAVKDWPGWCCTITCPDITD